MSASNKPWLVTCLLLVGSLGGCSGIVDADRTKIPDELFEVPEPKDAGMKDSGSSEPEPDEDAGETSGDAGDDEDAG